MSIRMNFSFVASLRSTSVWRSFRMVLACLAAMTFALPGTAMAQEAKRDYVLGSGDVIRINVYQNQDLTLEARISESGTISYPLLGQLTLGGLSVSEAERSIATGLLKGNFLRQPQVGILVLQVRGNQVSVLGVVSRPGRYPLEVNGMRLSEVLAAAGGVAPGGSDLVTLSGVRDGNLMRTTVDIGAMFAAGSGQQDPLVRNGDTLYVDRQPVVYIYGEVQRPGAMRLERGMTLMQAVAAGGGLTQRGTEKGIKVHRRDASGVIQAVESRLTDELKDGDVIRVAESLF
jgi:polysaccharide export outer membrane protein